MARWSNNLTLCINLFALLVGVGILTFGLTMLHTTISSCHTLLIMPCVRIGSVLVTVSLLGLLGSCLRSPFLLWLYLVFYFIIIIVMTVGVVLWIIVMIRGHIKLDVGQEYQFKEFSSWFKDNVFGVVDWPQVRQCMMDRDLCLLDSKTSQPFFSLPKLQSACCHLPPWCISDPNNATISDCHTWSMATDKMCYYCDSCIGGFLAQVSDLWRRLYPAYVVLLIVVTTIFALGCRAFQQHKADHYRKVCYTTKA